MDTPGLCDVKKMRQAAEAITKALRQEGIYKLFMVFTLDHGRLRSNDITLLKLVLESAKELTKYYLVINQVKKSMKDKLDADGIIRDILLRGGVPNEQLPQDTIVVERNNEIDGEPDTYLVDAHELIEFVDSAIGVQVHSERVDALKIQDFEKINAKLEEDISALQEKNIAFQHQISTISEEKDDEKKKREKLEERVKQL